MINAKKENDIFLKFRLEFFEMIMYYRKLSQSSVNMFS